MIKFKKNSKGGYAEFLDNNSEIWHVVVLNLFKICEN